MYIVSNVLPSLTLHISHAYLSQRFMTVVFSITHSYTNMHHINWFPVLIHTRKEMSNDFICIWHFILLHQIQDSTFFPQKNNIYKPWSSLHLWLNQKMKSFPHVTVFRLTTCILFLENARYRLNKTYLWNMELLGCDSYRSPNWPISRIHNTRCSMTVQIFIRCWESK